MTRPTYIIHVRPDHDDDNTTQQGLKHILKRLGRNYGLRCIYMTTEQEEAEREHTADLGKPRE